MSTESPIWICRENIDLDAATVREVLRRRRLTFTESRPFPWLFVVFTVSGFASQIEAAKREFKADEAEIWRERQW